MTYEVGPLDVPAVDEGEEEEAGGGQQPLRLVWRLALGEEWLQHTQHFYNYYRIRRKACRKKGFLIFPSPAGMSLTKLSLGGNNDVIYKLFPPMESFVSDIPAGDGNIEKLFLRCGERQSVKRSKTEKVKERNTWLNLTF
jgi:hypothetical protein